MHKVKFHKKIDSSTDFKVNIGLKYKEFIFDSNIGWRLNELLRRQTPCQSSRSSLIS